MTVEDDAAAPREEGADRLAAGGEVDLVEIDRCDEAAAIVEIGRPEVDLPHDAQPAGNDMRPSSAGVRAVVALQEKRMRHAGPDAPNTGTTPLTILPAGPAATCTIRTCMS